MAAPAQRLRFHLICLSYFVVVVVLLFRGALWPMTNRALGHENYDLPSLIAPFREFGFNEIARGNLPLWNPHILSGTPFLANWQSALLYPPSYLHLLMPTAAAINLGIALHIVLGGWFTSLWCRGRGMSTIASLLAGTIFVCSAPVFLRIYVGHTTMLHAMAWTPLVLLVVDRVLEQPAVRWVLLGAFAVAMSLLAGHPQVVYYTALAVGLTFCFRIREVKARWRVLAAMACVYIGGTLLAAAQVLPAMQAARESTRGGGVTARFAAVGSMPLENLVTFVAPDFFGGTGAADFSRGGFWEVTGYAGVATLILALHGALAGRRAHRHGALPLLGIFLVLALGSYTLLFDLMIRWFPGYSLHRAPARMLFLVSLYLALLAGAGLDALRTEPASSRRRYAMVPATVLCVLAVAAAFYLRWQLGMPGRGSWGRFLERYSLMAELGDAFVHKSGMAASDQFLLACVIAAAVGTLLGLPRFSPRLAGAIAAIAIVEVICFAAARTPLTPTSVNCPDVYTEAAQGAASRDERVLSLRRRLSNVGMAHGFNDIKGYDPLVLRRYADFLSATQDSKLGEMFVPSTEIRSSAFAMLRCGAFLGVDEKAQPKAYRAEAPPLARVHLVGAYRVMSKPEEALAAVTAPEFDARRVVVLEEEPDPQPQSVSVENVARVVRATTDTIEIEAKVSAPCLLLITDSFSAGWSAKPQAASAQREYRVLPANHALRAIPLAEGTHSILLEYVPWQFTVGKWISIASVVGMLVMCARELRRARERRT